MRKRAVRGNVEGHLNAGRKALNADAAGLLPYGAKLRWADSDTAESYLKDDQVIVRMSFKDHPHRNLVIAALMYFRSGILPNSTQYLRKPVQKALALLMVDQMLSKARRTDSLNYFRDEILEAECDNDAQISSEFDTLARLNETGYFLRVFIPELMDYPLATVAAPPRSGHYKETGAFLSHLRLLSDLVYIETYLSEHAGPQGLAPLDFFQRRIRTSFVIVGKRELLDRLGFDAHVKRIRWCRQQGCRVIYLTGHSAEPVFGVARAAEKAGIVEILDLHKIAGRGKYGPIQRGFARLRVTPLQGKELGPTPDQDKDEAGPTDHAEEQYGLPPST